MSQAIEVAQWLLFGYVIALNCGYLALNILSFASLREYAGRRDLEAARDRYTGLEPPVSILVPAYNEEATIAYSVRSILQLEYPELEVLVVNDGSRDNTLATLTREFELQPYPDPIQRKLECKPLRAVYRSAKYANLRVIDKENGGKADALNCAINAARYPLFCAVDADSVLQRQSLWRVVEPFLDDPHTIAAGGTVRIANGCTVEGGFVTRVDLPTDPLA
ncbi:MAG: glycosyltransferase family 2 protein, partial [Betaproteobacteria bacterium]|nr:glycosyltransferase family 2 protein [Betaproteobacteria bacterium]